MNTIHGLFALTIFSLFFFFTTDLYVSMPKFELETQLIGFDIAQRNPTHMKTVRKLSEFEKLELGLARSRATIHKAIKFNQHSSLQYDEDAPRGDVYRNPIAFYQSYIEMEKTFKIYVYEEGDKPILHAGPFKGVYSSEGLFIHEMELGLTKFRTRDAQHAHAYFMPFSVSMMVQYLWDGNLHDKSMLLRFVADYVRFVSTEYPYWNRTQGADHVMLSCHDWGPSSSRGNPTLYNNSIRVLCNANTSEGFDPRKDVSLPEINLKTGHFSSAQISVPPTDAPRPHLGFFSGRLHGHIRAILFQHWKNRDPDLLVYEELPKNLHYESFMNQSKYCLCPSGFEVASPRIVEAIYAECIPVTISDYYPLPFSDVLKWDEFSVAVDVRDIPKLKQILKAIPETEYWRLKEGVKAVKRHFVLNQPPKRFDMFHMILHSIWLRRLNVRFR